MTDSLLFWPDRKRPYPMSRKNLRKKQNDPSRQSRFTWSDDEIEFVEDATVGSAHQKPSMLLTSEGGVHRRRPSAKYVMSVIDTLDTGDGNSFCCLEVSADHYVQALHGLNGWHLEWREPGPRGAGSYRHYRAAFKHGSNRARLLRKSDRLTSQGLERDLLNTGQVVQCFLAFLRKEARPRSLAWRRLKM